MNIFRNPYKDWSPEKLLAYFYNRTNVQYFPVLDQEETTREKIDSILLNRFSFNGESYNLPENFDWTFNPSRDIEWLIMLHKFYYSVGLGLVYHQTQDQCYAEKWIDLTSSWIDTAPNGLLSSDVAGRRIQNWMFAHYYFVTLDKSPIITAEFYMKFLGSIHSQVSNLCNNLTPARNHRTLELYAIFMAAVVFPELQSADEWLGFSRQELLKNIKNDILSDGVQCELSTDYHHIVLKNYLGVKRLALLNQISLPEEIDVRIRKALRFSLHVHKPDGKIPSLSDGDTLSFLELIEMGYKFYNDKEMLYVSSKGKLGTLPAVCSTLFPESGYCVLRSDWGNGSEPYEDERYLVFDCGPLGAGNHGHFDLLSFEMAAYGQSLIVDPGRYTYDESGDVNWRVIFRGTGYHNTVLVDKKNQIRYLFDKTRFKIKGPEPERELKAFISRQGFDYLHGIARSYEYEAVHERKIFFAKPEYWIVSDYLISTETHNYDLLFHLSDKAYGKTSFDMFNGTILAKAPHLVIALPNVIRMSHHFDSGYVSCAYGKKIPAPIVRFSRQAKDTVYHTILYPYKKNEPQIAIKEISVQRGAETCNAYEASAISITISIDNQSFKDCYFTTRLDRQKEYTFNGFTYNGAFLFVRKNNKGDIIKMHSENGSTLVDSGKTIQPMENHK